MADSFLGEIRLVSFNFPPRGWAFCNGQLLPINQNQALFSLLGTTYGGNGQTTFALPDLRAAQPLGRGQSPGGPAIHDLGAKGGKETHTIVPQEMPAHTHAVAVVNSPGTQTTAAGNYMAAHRGGYGESANAVAAGATVGMAGGSQPHENMAPFLTLSFCISLQGEFPSMSTPSATIGPFVAEMRIFPYNFAPAGWAFCEGQLLPISQNTALFSLLGTSYGGNGQTNFALPNFSGSLPMHSGSGPGLSPRSVGEAGGAEEVTLTQSELPSHNHAVTAPSATPQSPLTGPALGTSAARGYHPGPPNGQASGAALQVAGASTPHNNMPPYLTFNFCIALQGIFPPRA